MDKKVVLITGASGGMGSSIAELLRDKYILALHAHTNEVSLTKSDSLESFKADLSSEDGCKRLIEEVMNRYGRIDVLINNAGISKSAMSWKTEQDDWNATIAINLNAPFFLSKNVIPHMKENHFGRIINITSIVAQTGFIGTSAYAASKAGLIGLTKTLSKELARYPITVNALALGYFNVGMINDVPLEIQEEIISQIPKNQLGDPTTVTRTIEWLIEDTSAYVTGQTINLNGGLYS